MLDVFLTPFAAQGVPPLPECLPIVSLPAHPTNEKPQGEWNDYEIIVQGGDLTLKVNGLVQNEATEVLEVSGPIGLQSEGAPIEYRNIRLVPLDQ
ncbi:MAG TPA: DUF1080 domain-containing protein [Thermoguttaceae bacterium]|nr:DUF1080 domain-containing protein [Thermoguttaceae bacterium]